MSPGYSAPWAGPGVPVKAIKWLLMRHRPLVIRANLDLDLLRWGLAMLRNCTAARYELNKSPHGATRRIQPRLPEGAARQTGIAYDERTQGTLQLFRTQQAARRQRQRHRGPEAQRRAFELLDRAGCIAHEPALALVRDKFVGGLRLPGDETGDCFKFTQRLATLAAQPAA